jgi:drug/metabolite transporter (DMT)-like permease
MRRLHPVDAMLLVTVVLWSLNFTVIKYLLNHGFKPAAFVSLRYAAAAVIFAAITFARERSLLVEARDFWFLLLPGAALLVINQWALTYAIRFTTASSVALVMGAVPIFVALVAWSVGYDRLTRAFWLGAALSLAGVGLVAAGSGGVSVDLKGVLLALLTAVCWAAYSVALVPLMRRYSAWRISAIVLLAAAVGLLATASPQLAEQDFHLEAGVWLGLAYAVLGPLVVTNILYFTAVDRVGPARSALFANLQPFLGALFAILLLSEHLSALEIAGGAAILLGIVVERRARVTTVPQPGAD